MKKIIFLVLIPFMIFAQKGEINHAITADEVQQHINFLASDELEGRMTGTEGCYEAGDYIADEMKLYGLKPLFDGSYFQEFEFTADIELTDNNSVIFNLDGEKIELKSETDFITAPFSGDQNATGKVVFAGYGISAPRVEYDDYEGLDVEGKFVMVFRFHPEHDSVMSPFDGFSSFRDKATVAFGKGALGIIFVNPPQPEMEEDKLMKFRYDRGGKVDIGAVHIKQEFAAKIFKSAGKDISEIQKKIDADKKPVTFEIDGLEVSLQTEVKEIVHKGRNVAGYLEGNDPELKNEYIVVGAHYDHLGYGEHGSLFRGEGKEIHNGADDNASGTVGVIELAEKFAGNKDKIKRSMIFTTFSGEELGLLGSRHFVDNSPVRPEEMVAMFNMDMIGRLKEDTSLTVFGTGTATEWNDLLNSKNEKYHFNLTLNKDGYSPSDNTSFYAEKVPVLFFFTGVHPDYHRPSDDADKIEAEGEEMILKYVYDIISAVDSEDKKPEYVAVPRKKMQSSGGWKVYVGTIPDYAYEGGYKLSGVSDGGPAQRAGMKGGDIMIKFGDRKISNIYDYVYALKEHVPGDHVEVVVMRGDEELKFEIELGVR